MKSTRILTAILIALFLVLAMIACASAAEVHPVPATVTILSTNRWKSLTKLPISKPT